MSQPEGARDQLRQLERLDAACRRFELAWKAGGQPRLEGELEAASAQDRAPLLAELLPLEWVYRGRLGEEVRRQDYRARFPALADVIDRAWEQWQADQSDSPLETAAPAGRPTGHAGAAPLLPVPAPRYEQLE